MFFKADKKIFKFFYSEILFFEGCGNYVKIYTTQQAPIMVLDKLSDLENKLPDNQFSRVHKSYIVNVKHIRQIEGNMLKVEKHEIPVGQNYRENVMKQIKI